MRVRLSQKNSSSPGPTTAGKLIASLFFAIFAGFGGVFIYVMTISYLWPVLQVYWWDSIPCVIETADPVEQQLSFRYHYAARDYSSDQWKPESNLPGEKSDLEALFSLYPEGSSHTCLVNPENPEQAYLEKGSLLLAPFLLIPLIFFLIGLGGIVRTWRRKPLPEKVHPTPPAKEAISTSGFENKSRLVGALFFLVFFLFGIGFLYLLVIQPAIDAYRARGWQQVPCVILSSQVRSHASSDGTTYSVDILYRYSVAGTSYKSNRYSFFTGSSSGYSGKEKVVNQYPVGSTSLCFVNPEDPTEAVLSKELGRELLWGLLPLLFVMVGLGGILFSLRFKSMRKSTFPPGGRIYSKDMKKPPVRELSPKVPHTLRPKTGRWVRLVMITLVALFWNGVISVFLHELYLSFMHGNPNWFLTLFMTPFVLVGLALVIGIFYQALTLATPMPTLELERYPLHLGEDCRLNWSFQGRVSRIQEMEIFLVGREEASYRRGTNTSTDVHVFYERSLIQSSYHRQVAKGQVKFRVPAKSVPTFTAANNRIVWTVKIHGTIDRWPDVREDFELLVLPLEGEDSWRR